MPQFSPDQCAFGDLPGYGAWDVSHGREHIQFVQAAATGSPSILIPDFDLLTFLTAPKHVQRSIALSHAQSHNLLWAATGLSGMDYSQFDLNNQDDFYTFLAWHSTDHAQIRQFYGIT